MVIQIKKKTVVVASNSQTSSLPPLPLQENTVELKYLIKQTNYGERVVVRSQKYLAKYKLPSSVTMPDEDNHDEYDEVNHLA